MTLLVAAQGRAVNSVAKDATEITTESHSPVGPRPKKKAVHDHDHDHVQVNDYDHVNRVEKRYSNSPILNCYRKEVN